MGADAVIEVRIPDATPEEINDLAYDLARRVGSTYFLEHPSIRHHAWEDDPDVYAINIWSRYWGPGYERGDWPTIRAFLAILLDWEERGRIEDVWYYADSDGREYTDPLTRSELSKLDEHFASGSWDYSWKDSSFNRGPSQVPTPTDSYGKPMIRQSSGQRHVIFQSPATLERREWRDGEWVAS